MASVDATQRDYKTYRVLGVNKTWDVEKLRACLASQPGDIQPKVLSLATETDRRSQTATVVFQNGRVPNSPTRPENIVIEHTFHGITPLFTPSKENHKVDIIAISGLGGHAFGSFKQRGGYHMWLRDSLPEDLVEEGYDEHDRPIARIMVYGYASELDDRTSFQSMEDIASSYRQAVEDCRLTKPTIFIGHSLGGILVKEAFIHWTQSKHHAKLLQAVHAIVFFAVPHDGMEITSLIPMVGNTNRKLIDLLDRHNPTKLSNQREQFLKALIARPETEIFCFYETQLSHTAQKDEDHPGKWKMDGPLAVLVSQPSATIYRPGEDSPMPIAAINRSHSEIVKFGPHDAEYKNVRGALRGLCERAIEKQQHPAVQMSESILKRRETLMRSLKFPQIDERLSNVKSPHKKTYEWILDDPTFRKWQGSTQDSDKHRMIWIKGIPGAGKSTIMKFAYNQVRKRTAENVLVSSFFFNARGDELEKTVPGMYRSLLWQLLNHFTDLQTVFDDSEMLSPYRNHCSLLELQSLLRGAVLQLGQRSLFWFIDALDECKETEVADMIHYFEELGASTLANGINLAICVSSRHYPTIRMRRAHDLVLETNLHHERDLKAYITDRLRVDEPDIVEKVFAKASGVFLWVVLVVDILNREDQNGGFSMSRRLDEVPGDLRGLFVQLLGEKTGDAVRNETTKLSMLWLLFARRPLGPIQYCNAIWAGLSSKGLLKDDVPPWDDTMPNAHERATRYVISSSKGLARVPAVTETGVFSNVQLIHETIRDFLLKEDGFARLWPELKTDIKAFSNLTLRQSCMSYWNHLSKSSSRSPAEQDYRHSSTDGTAFLDYIVDFVLCHAEASASTFPQESFLLEFPVASYVAAREQGDDIDSLNRNPDFLYILSFYGYARLISAFLQLESAGRYTAGRAGRHRFPALVAAAEGNQEAFSALVSTPTDIYVGADLFEGFQCLQDLWGDMSDWIPYELLTPMTWAASRGYTQMVKKLLLQYKEDINQSDRYGRTPLSAAAGGGSEELTRFLLGKGADIEAGEPLATVSERGYEEIARLLIEKGADINAGYPLAKASRRGHEEIVQLLIEKGVDINAGYPLAKASGRGREEIVRLLIEKGADINAGYPLAKASVIGRKEIVQLLIEKGADINAGYPLAKASRRGHEEIVQLLIEKGADINAAVILSLRPR